MAEPAPSSLTASSPRIGERAAERIAAEHYGIEALAERLAGEKDDNFRLRGRDGSHLLKVAHAADSVETTSLSTAALLWLGDLEDPPVQRVVPARDGAAQPLVMTADGPRLARMTTFLDGELLRHVPTSPLLRENVGAALARLGQALHGFTHPAAGRTLLWDLKRAPEARELLDQLGAAQRLAPVRATFDRFEADVLPRLAALRAQVIHNDLSADNTVIAPDAVSVIGIIDFGDIVETQLIVDVAVAAASHVGSGADALAPVVDLVRGYHRVEPLSDEELSLLYDLIRQRAALRIAISEYRAALFPENRDYILRYTPRAWSELERMPISGADAAARRLRAACEDR